MTKYIKNLLLPVYTEGGIFLLLFSLSTLFCRAQTLDTTVIICFGNSTTAPRKTVNRVYPDRLHEALSATGRANKVINAGIGGSHSGSVTDNNKYKIRHAKDRFESDVLNPNPHWVVIAFGINDAWQDNGRDSACRIPIEQYIKNLTYFIDEIQKKNGQAILLTPNPIGRKYENWRFEKLKEYAEATKRLAIHKKAALVDVWAIFHQKTDNIDTLLLDGMHPNDKGHELVAEAIFNIIAKKMPFFPQKPIYTEGGTMTKDSIWLAPNVTEIEGLKMGPFIQLADDNLLTVDTINSYISVDKGKTWRAYPIFNEPQKFAIRPERAIIRTKSGVIILAFVNDKERANWNWRTDIHDSPDAILPTYTVRSLDGGKTWTDLQKLHDDWTGAIRDIIETNDGHIVFTSMMMRHNPGHHTVLTYTTDNDGKTWTRSNIIDLGGIGHHSGVTESTLTQLKDGRLWMLMRTNWGKFWETFSMDNGLTWQNFKATNIDASSAPAMLKRLKSGRLVLIWNRYFPEGKKEYPLKGGDKQWSEVPVSNHREELSIMFSDTEGGTWSEPVVFAKVLKKDAQISYPYLYENTYGTSRDTREGGELWITTMFGGLRVKLLEKDFIKKTIVDTVFAQKKPYFGMRLRKMPENVKDIYAPVLIKLAPSNESTIIRLASGVLKIFYINRPGKADKMMSIASTDMGLTWAEPQIEFDLHGEAYYANQVMQDKNGTIHCVFHIYGKGEKGYRGRHLNLWYTQQLQGQNWSNPKMIWEGYVGSIRGFIQLKNNTLLIPMSEADPARANKPAAGETDYGLFSIICLYSTDLGQTWNKTENSLKIPVESTQVTRYGAVEPNAIELKNGKIWMLIRTNKGHLYETFSNDSGKTWSEPQESPFISSDSPATTLRLSNGKILLMWSGNQRYDDKRSYANGGREVLHAAISDDEGQTWKGFREVLVSPPSVVIKGDRGTAYSSVIETKNGKIVFVSGQGDERSIAIFDPKWLAEKTAQDDFSNGLVQWTLFGTDSLTHIYTYNGQNTLLVGNKKGEAVWNFPMTKKGALYLQIMPNSTTQTINIALNEHFSVSFDTAAFKNAGVYFSLNLSKQSEMTIKVKWNTDAQKARIYINDKLIEEKSFQKKGIQSFNYLRLGIPNSERDAPSFILKSVKLK